MHTSTLSSETVALNNHVPCRATNKYHAHIQHKGLVLPTTHTATQKKLWHSGFGHVSTQSQHTGSALPTNTAKPRRYNGFVHVSTGSHGWKHSNASTVGNASQTPQPMPRTSRRAAPTPPSLPNLRERRSQLHTLQL